MNTETLSDTEKPKVICGACPCPGKACTTCSDWASSPVRSMGGRAYREAMERIRSRHWVERKKADDTEGGSCD